MKNYKTSFILIFAFFIFFNTKSQNVIHNNIMIICDSIDSFNKLSINERYKNGSTNEQFSLFNRLLKKASNDDLLELINKSESPIIKCYSFWGLSKRQNDNLFEILLKNMHDNRTIKVSYGGIEVYEKVGDFFIDVMTNGKVEKEIRKFSNKEKETLDSILIFDDNIFLSAKNELLRNYIPKESQYSKIKEIANRNNYHFGIVALAKFKKQEDVDLILKLLQNDTTEYYGLLAVREFNDTLFYNHLVEKLYQILKSKKLDSPKIRVFYQALAQYPTNQTKTYLEYVLKKTRGFKRKVHEKYIWLAIDKYPNEIWDGIKSKIEITEVDKISIEKEREF